MRFYKGDALRSKSKTKAGFIANTVLSMVVKLTGPLQVHLSNYLKEAD